VRRYVRPVVYGSLSLLAAAAIYLICYPPFRTEVPPRREIPYAPPAVRAPELTGLVDRGAKITERVPPDITSRIQDLKNRNDEPAVIAVLMDTKDDDTVRNEAANLLRRAGCRSLTDRLIRILWDPGEKARFRSFCVQHLWTNLRKAEEAEKARIMEALHKAVADKEIKVRREALLALVRQRDPKGRELAVRWLTGPEGDGARDLAIHCVHDLGLKEHIPAIRGHLGDSDEPTRRAAIVTLSGWGDGESRPAFEAAARSRAVRIQRAGKAALKRLEKAE